MTIRQSDLKLLWGRSGNRCAICCCELSFDPQHATAVVPLGEQAHIVAKEPDGPRGASILLPDERDTYDNLILLCPTHHTCIDKVPGDYPVEKLHLIKSRHERWVQTQLSGDRPADIADQVYAALLDSFVENCAAARWAEWASRAIELEPIWSSDLVNSTTDFDVAVQAAVWPGTRSELERAFQTLAISLREARETFLCRAVHEKEPATSNLPMRRQYRGVKFYKELREWNPERYEELFTEWRTWQTKCQALMFEVTRAANWLADCARREITPGFFAVEGRFHLFATLMSDLPGHLWIPEYTQQERNELPDTLPGRLNNFRDLFTFRLAPDD